MDEHSTHLMAHRLAKVHCDQAINHVLQRMEEAAAADDQSSLKLWADVFQTIYHWERPESHTQH